MMHIVTNYMMKETGKTFQFCMPIPPKEFFDPNMPERFVPHRANYVRMTCDGEVVRRIGHGYLECLWIVRDAIKQYTDSGATFKTDRSGITIRDHIYRLYFFKRCRGSKNRRLMSMIEFSTDHRTLVIAHVYFFGKYDSRFVFKPDDPRDEAEFRNRRIGPFIDLMQDDEVKFWTKWIPDRTMPYLNGKIAHWVNSQNPDPKS